MMQIDPTTATEWAKEITVVLRTEYPASMHHVSGNRNDCSVVPHKLHPAFWGSFDWHSSVHMQFSAVKLLDIIPSGAIRQDLVQELAGRLNVDAIAVETAYLSEHSGYERLYGWAWALQLAAACKQANFEEATEWFRALVPLAHQVATHFLDWLPQMPLPVRHGVHDNTALSLFLAHEAGKKLGLKDLCERIREVGVSWYLNDQNYPYGWELSAHDFVSASLSEALFMQSILDEREFANWFDAFFDDPGDAICFYSEIPEVSDLEDGKLAHLFGLALTRAWMLRALRSHFAGADRSITAVSDELFEKARQQLVAADFMSTHWLITYAILAEEAKTVTP